MAEPEARAPAHEPAPEPALSCEQLTARYGPLEVVRGFDLTMARGEIVALLGVNGAGKSSIAGALAGVTSGSGVVRVGGRRVDRLPAYRRARAGLALVPEDRGLFADLSVEDNLRLGAGLGRRGPGALAPAFAMFPILQERRGQDAGTLSGGEQQMLAIARALLTDPIAVIVDEPTQGLAPELCHRIAASLRRLADDGLAVLLIEQNLDFAELADRFVIIADGQVVDQGGRETIADRARVLDTFLS